MNIRRARRVLTCAAVLCSAAGSASAAPLDALLDVSDDPRGPSRWRVEVSGDITQPVFDATGIDKTAGKTQTARLGWVSGPWSLEVGGDRRAIPDKTSLHHVRSWRTAVQYEPGNADALTSLRWAVRLGAWGDQSDQLVQTSDRSLKVSGLKARLNEMRLIKPSDLQWQLDLIGRYTLTGTGLGFSAFAGAGTSSVTRAGVGGKATISGCAYQLQFGSDRLTAIPDGGCEKALIVSVPNSLVQFDALRESQYQARYMHAGAAAHWRPGAWRISLGGELQQWLRDGVDDRLDAANQTPLTRNAVLAGQTSYDFTPALSVVLRGQYMHHQLLGEVPMLYNARTASGFKRRYAAASAGIVLTF